MFRWCALSLIFGCSAFADLVVWNGQVSSDGTPSTPIELKLNDKYQIQVSGYINLGKWIQNTQELANDACYEFNQEGKATKVETFKNSLNIAVCANSKYNADHVYTSEVFTAEQNRIHFWIHDSNYDDNSGTFFVQIIKK